MFTSLAARNGTLPSSNEGLALSLELARAASEGDLPSDELLKRLSSFVGSPIAPEIPKQFRDTFETLSSPTKSALSQAGVLAISNQLVDTLDQIPLLIDEVAGGARDFVPTPASTRTVARRAYRARRTLVVQYSDDPIDESDEILELLQEAESVFRMKRPMVEFDIQLQRLEGGHASPLLAPPLDLASTAEDLLGKDSAKEKLLYKEADATVELLSQWLQEGSL